MKTDSRQKDGLEQCFQSGSILFMESKWLYRLTNPQSCIETRKAILSCYGSLVGHLIDRQVSCNCSGWFVFFIKFGSMLFYVSKQDLLVEVFKRVSRLLL